MFLPILKGNNCFDKAEALLQVIIYRPTGEILVKMTYIGV